MLERYRSALRGLSRNADGQGGDSGAPSKHADEYFSRDRGPQCAAGVETRDRVRLPRRRATRHGPGDGASRRCAAPRPDRRREHDARVPARGRPRLPLPRDRRARHQRRCPAGLPRRGPRPRHRPRRPGRRPHRGAGGARADRRGARRAHDGRAPRCLPGLPVQHRPEVGHGGDPAGGAARPERSPRPGVRRVVLREAARTRSDGPPPVGWPPRRLRPRWLPCGSRRSDRSAAGLP